MDTQDLGLEKSTNTASKGASIRVHQRPHKWQKIGNIEVIPMGAPESQGGAHGSWDRKQDLRLISKCKT